MKGPFARSKRAYIEFGNELDTLYIGDGELVAFDILIWFCNVSTNSLINHS